MEYSPLTCIFSLQSVPDAVNPSPEVVEERETRETEEEGTDTLSPPESFDSTIKTVTTVFCCC